MSLKDKMFDLATAIKMGQNVKAEEILASIKAEYETDELHPWFKDEINLAIYKDYAGPIWYLPLVTSGDPEDLDSEFLWGEIQLTVSLSASLKRQLQPPGKFPLTEGEFITKAIEWMEKSLKNERAENVRKKRQKSLKKLRALDETGLFK